MAKQQKAELKYGEYLCATSTKILIKFVLSK